MAELSAKIVQLQEQTSRSEQAQQASTSASAAAGAPLSKLCLIQPCRVLVQRAEHALKLKKGRCEKKKWCIAAAAEALERGNLARDYEKRLQRMEQECAHRIRAVERKMAKG